MSLPAEYFDRMYAENADPWGFASRWYEQRKYALTLAALPRGRYRAGFEPGCSNGVLTAGLAERCDTLLACDAAHIPVAAAAARLARYEGVRVERRRMPADWPDEHFDLIVLSEIGYYLDPAGLEQLVDAAVKSLEPGGDLAMVHWRRPVPDYPFTGDVVHSAFADHPGLQRTVEHREQDFLLEVFSRVPPPARSVATIEGLC